MGAGHYSYAKQRSDGTRIIKELTNAKRRNCTWKEEALEYWNVYKTVGIQWAG